MEIISRFPRNILSRPYWISVYYNRDLVGLFFNHHSSFSTVIKLSEFIEFSFTLITMVEKLYFRE